MIRKQLQLLRDNANRECELAAQRGDRDSADAWESIGMVLDDAQKRIRFAARVIEERTGLFQKHD